MSAVYRLLPAIDFAGVLRSPESEHLLDALKTLSVDPAIETGLRTRAHALWTSLTSPSGAQNPLPNVTKHSLSQIIENFSADDLQTALKSLERWVGILDEDADAAEMVRQEVSSKYFTILNTEKTASPKK